MIMSEEKALSMGERQTLYMQHATHCATHNTDTTHYATHSTVTTHYATHNTETTTRYTKSTLNLIRSIEIDKALTRIIK